MILTGLFVAPMGGDVTFENEVEMDGVCTTGASDFDFRQLEEDEAAGVATSDSIADKRALRSCFRFSTRSSAEVAVDAASCAANWASSSARCFLRRSRFWAGVRASLDASCSRRARISAADSLGELLTWAWRAAKRCLRASFRFSLYGRQLVNQMKKANVRVILKVHFFRGYNDGDSHWLVFSKQTPRERKRELSECNIQDTFVAYSACSAISTTGSLASFFSASADGCSSAS